jgi:hypothetical protein
MPKKGKIGTIDEFTKKHKDEWLLLEVLELNEQDEPTVGRLVDHSPSRKNIMKSLKGSTNKDVCLMFAGDIPKKGTLLIF